MKVALPFKLKKDGRYLSFSLISDKLRCDYKHDLAWNRRINSRAMMPRMDVGSAIHQGFTTALLKHAEMTRPPNAAVQRGLGGMAAKSALRWFKDWVGRRGGETSLTPEEQTALPEMREAAAAVAERGVVALGLDSWQTVRLAGKPLVEPLLVAPLIEGWDGFVFHPDWIAKYLPTKQIWSVDFKSRVSFTPPEDEEVDLQGALYQRGLLHFGIKAAGSAVFQMLSRPPAEPKVNKDGSLSRARVATTWEVYRAALVRNGLNPAEYADMQTKLDVVFFRLDKAYRSLPELETIWRSVAVRMAAMLDAEREENIYALVPPPRHLSRINCRGCWAREFCLTELRGGDTEWLLRTQYVDVVNPHERIILSPDDVEMEEAE